MYQYMSRNNPVCFDPWNPGPFFFFYWDDGCLLSGKILTNAPSDFDPHFSTRVCSPVKKYRVPKIKRPSTHRTVSNSAVCTNAFYQGHALLRWCLWKADSQLWGDCQYSYTPTHTPIYTHIGERDLLFFFFFFFFYSKEHVLAHTDNLSY